MAEKGKRNDGDRKTVQGGNGGSRENNPKPIFIEGYLNAEDKEWLQAHLDDQHILIAELLQSVGEEYVVSCKFDHTSLRFQSSLTCRVKNHINSGCVLVSRGATPLDSLYALAYRHLFKFEGEWRGTSGEVEGLWD